LLKLFAGGVVLASVFVAPNMAVVLTPKRKTSKAPTDEENAEYKRLVRHMKRLNLISVENLADGNQYVTLTSKGRERLSVASIDEIEITLPKAWDGKWRIISFDIPAHKKKQRYTFLHHLHRLGFIAALESMWVYPFECEKEVYEIARACGLEGHLIMITGNLTQDRHLHLAKSFNHLLKNRHLDYEK
jgi:DNA-binding transcriptional regulator PaaX